MLDEWNELIKLLPGASFLQSSQWGKIKSHYKWEPEFYFWEKADGEIEMNKSISEGKEPLAGALVLSRSITLFKRIRPFRMLYLPRGPLLDWEDDTLRRKILLDLQCLAQQKGVLFIKIDPFITMGTGNPDDCYVENQNGVNAKEDFQLHGWRFSGEQVQFRNTVLIDLKQDREILLGRMKQKTRYNIRLAERKGVEVRSGTVDDLDLLYRMYAETSLRDGFVIRDQTYYKTVWLTFLEANMADLLIAEVENEPVAALILIRFGQRASYVYGMSRDLHRDKMPNYLLQWKAICRAQDLNCQVYDLWGAPDKFNESDPLWGVYRFKLGLGGETFHTIGAWDYTVKPGMYSLFTKVLPRFLDVLRRKGIQNTIKRTNYDIST